MGHTQVAGYTQERNRMIGEAFEITIVVSMLVLVGYPSIMMAMEALQERRRRRVKAVPHQYRPNKR